MSPSKLFQPLKVGNCQLQHRVIMAPLTRFRADDDHTPLPFVEEYYEQRASVPGTMLITEATFISQRAGGYPNVPGIYNAAQIAAWKTITDTVHSKGSFIWLQLWSLGRVANKDLLETEGGKLLSSSAVPASANAPTPAEMTEEEIRNFISDYATAAKNAMEAGFDGVEIHGANGYMIDQFFQDTCNRRTDAWGGSVEKRSRFGLEVTKAVIEAIGAERTGIRLSPFSPFQGMKMADPVPQFLHIARELKALKLAYLHVVESRISGNADIEAVETIDFLVDEWENTSPVVIAGGFRPDSAKSAVDEKYIKSDVGIAFGRHFITNPDLPFRLKKAIELTPYDRDTFYTPKATKGYTDYPFSPQFGNATVRL